MYSLLLRFSAHLLLFILLFSNVVCAHAFIVTGNITTVPIDAKPREMFTLYIDMTDSAGTPVEDAIVAAEFTKDGRMRRFEFSAGDRPGLYFTKVNLPEEGEYSLLLRDTTYSQEEARATLTFTLGIKQIEQIPFIFPLTKTSSNPLSVWLIWIIGIPILAGIIVTVVVLRRAPR